MSHCKAINRNTVLYGDKIRTEKEKWLHMWETENLDEYPCRFELETLLFAETKSKNLVAELKI